MLVPGEVISAIINGTDELLAELREMGIGIYPTGGETADVGDLVRTIIVDSTVTCRMKRADVIDNANIRPGDDRVETKDKVPGRYMDITGNKATAYGFIAAAEKAGLRLYLGSYPITPATDVLHELSKHKSCGVITVQCEDEISGCASALGASFAGALGVTSTSGPGVCLKSEAMNLAVIMELPLVVLDVQRGGPATGLPTK